MSEPTSEEYRIESVRSDSGLFVTSWQQGDRFSHQIGLFNGDAKRVLLNSVEGMDVEFWPASPPLQQVYQQEIAGDPVMLAVGMAGKNHYSMSARLAGRDESASLKFESACLVKQREPEVFLGNTYQLALGIFVQSGDLGAVLRDSDGGQSLATVEGCNGTTVEISSRKEIRFVPISGQPSDGLAGQKPDLTRCEPTQWSYLVRMSPGS